MSLPAALEGAPHIGSTTNCAYYTVGDGILVAYPHDEATDDEATARENIAYQRDHWVAQGRRGVVAVYVDRLIDQTPGARRVYAAETDPEWFVCIGLVGGSMLSRAMASFFVGLARPRVPVHFVPDLEALRERVAAQPEARSGPLSP